MSRFKAQAAVAYLKRFTPEIRCRRMSTTR
jgi:hypothetical protein